MFNTPPTKSTLASSTATPPSPPMSETSSSMRKSINAMPGFPRQKAYGSELMGSRSLHASKPPRYSHSRTTSLAYSNGRSTPSVASRPTLTKPSHSYTSTNTNRPAGLPKSGSLYQIRGLIGKMQKLEERVQSAKSKLPPPSDSPSRASSRAASSRAGSVLGDSPVASSSITMRRNSRKRLSGSSFSSSVREGEGTPSNIPQSRPTYSSRAPGESRPNSRSSFSSSISYSTHLSKAPSSTRPESRHSRTKTPLGHYSTNPTTESRRPRSSLSNPSAHSASVNGMSHIDEDEDLSLNMSVRAKISEARQTCLPSISTPNGVKKRAPSGIPTPRTFKASTGPENQPGDDLGETF